MYKKLLLVAVIGILFTNTGFASDKIGTVDLQRVVDNSSQVKALKKSHDAKIKELDKIVTDAQLEIKKETDLNKIMAAEEKYRNIFNNKKNEIEKDYSAKLAEIERSIQAKIKEKANSSGYDYIFAKSVVLHGGDDITDEIIKTIK